MSLRDVARRLEAEFDVRAYLEPSTRVEHGHEWAVPCPRCEKEDKLWVRVGGDDPARIGRWICYRCDEGGGPLELVQLLDEVSFFGALEVLKRHSRYVEREADLRGAVERAFAALPAVAEEKPIPPCKLPEGFVPAEGAFRLPAYFRERGISRDRAEEHGLGFCASGRYANRLIVPVHLKGKLAWFLGRWMEKVPPSGVKKYLNSVAAPASRTLFGIDQARRSKRIVLVEDAFSKIHVGRGAAAICGTHFSTAQLELLAETEADEVVVCLDADATDKAWKLGEALSELWTTRVLVLPDERDPDEYPRAEFEEMMSAAPIVGSRASFRQRVEGALRRI